MAYSWNRSGERVIPISIESDRPVPTDPYPQRPLNPAPYQPTPSSLRDPYPHPPVPPTRRHYGRDPADDPPSYPPPPVPVPSPAIPSRPAPGPTIPSRPAAPPIKEVGRNHSDFRSHELDEMDTLAEMLKQKREAENKLKSGTNPYRNNYTEATTGGGTDESIPAESAASQSTVSAESDCMVGGASPGPQMGFFIPTAPNPGGTGANLPYPTAASGVIPPYPPAGYGNPSGISQLPCPAPNYPNPYQ